jgi:hypothetical protein
MDCDARGEWLSVFIRITCGRFTSLQRGGKVALKDMRGRCSRPCR